MNYWFDRYVDAIKMATLAHDGQRRKFTKEPYVTHPIRVSKLVFQETGSYQHAVAAVLHDVVEDTGVTVAQIRAEFGEFVADLVQSVTKNKLLPKAEQEQEYLLRFFGSSLDTVIVKLCDRLDNVREMLHPDTAADFRVKYAKNTQNLLNAIPMNLRSKQTVHNLAFSIIEIFELAPWGAKVTWEK